MPSKRKRPIKRSRKRPHRRVCLLVPTARDWSRQILQGVANYANERGNWDFHLEPRGLYERLRFPSGWSGDGVIFRPADAALARAVRRSGLPAVNVSWLGSHSREAPKVNADQIASGKVAAEHFLEKGFRSFGYVGPLPELGYDDLLGKEYVRVINERGFSCSEFPRKGGLNKDEVQKRRAELKRWLRQLPRPVGILVWNSAIGYEIMLLCEMLNVPVPDEVSVVCSEHDPLVSSLAPVPLSNIDQAPNRVGYQAAALLDRLMAGEPALDEPILIPPLGIIHRLSSDTSAVGDPLVAEALKFIRDHPTDPIQVIDLVKALSVSRRALEHHFTVALGRTPAAEIRRDRVERAKRLLAETDLPIAQIARQTGFNHTEVLIRTFRREVGLSPSAYRHSH